MQTGGKKLRMQQFGTLTFWSEETSTATYKVAEGYLGKNNPTLLDDAAKRPISEGTGDHAGHLIARRFGGPDAECNLGRQNYIQNRAKGTYYKTEQIWARVLKAGGKVHVTVRERTILSADRPAARKVQWTITHANGTSESGELSFFNSSSDEVRAKSGIPTKQYDKLADVIPIRRM